jgi:[ribosomal protein S5]-alanine N-acetyltransferase
LWRDESVHRRPPLARSSADIGRMPMIRTERLLLVPGTEAHLVAELESVGAFASAIGMHVPAEWPPEFYDADAVRWTLHSLRENPDQHGWSLYYVTLPERDGQRATAIGAAGFKGPPDARGEVELGYGVLPSYQRQGYATEAVRGMMSFAFGDPRVKTVIGQTIPSLVASIGVLQKAGFIFDGTGDPHAPEGETVLRYTFTRDRYERT